MEENLTRQHKLVEEITSSGWFADPAGKEGYEILVLEKVGNGGTRYYASLKAGEKLRWTERLFSQYLVYQVDLRRARAFSVSGQFSTRERGRSVTLSANVRYHVANARTVATQTVDPLGELRDKVISTLNKDLKRYTENEVTPDVVETIIENIGNLPHLGLAIESAEVQNLGGDSRVTQHIVEEEDIRHNISIGEIRHQSELSARDLDHEADIRREQQSHDADIKRRQQLHDAIDLRNMNVFMHEHPELVQQILLTLTARDNKLLDANIDVAKASVDRYIAQQLEMNQVIDPVEVGRIMRESVGTSSLQIGTTDTNPRLIEWGDTVDEKHDEKLADEKKGDKPNPKIDFGD